jgi:8-oxo-dGTP pyrophosphatase MutT (NUDIX family)
MITFCKFCGDNMGEIKSYPIQCKNPTCQNWHYRNPIPVVVGLVRCFKNPNEISQYGILLVRRSRSQTWALPGGFVDTNDTNWMTALSREVLEETGLVVPPIWRLESIETATDKNILIFASSDSAIQYVSDTPPVNAETDGLSLTAIPKVLAFPTHTMMLKRYLED